MQPAAQPAQAVPLQGRQFRQLPGVAAQFRVAGLEQAAVGLVHIAGQDLDRRDLAADLRGAPVCIQVQGEAEQADLPGQGIVHRQGHPRRDAGGPGIRIHVPHAGVGEQGIVPDQGPGALHGVPDHRVNSQVVLPGVEVQVVPGVGAEQQVHARVVFPGQQSQGVDEKCSKPRDWAMRSVRSSSSAWLLAWSRASRGSRFMIAVVASPTACKVRPQPSGLLCRKHNPAPPFPGRVQRASCCSRQCSLAWSSSFRSGSGSSGTKWSLKAAAAASGRAGS